MPRNWRTLRPQYSSGSVGPGEHISSLFPLRCWFTVHRPVRRSLGAGRITALGQSGIPFLAFNSLTTDTEKSEQSGLMNLFVGMFGTFRNVTAHGPKVSWNMTELDALDLMTLVSLLHRRLDASVATQEGHES